MTNTIIKLYGGKDQLNLHSYLLDGITATSVNNKDGTTSYTITNATDLQTISDRLKAMNQGGYLYDTNKNLGDDTGEAWLTTAEATAIKTAWELSKVGPRSKKIVPPVFGDQGMKVRDILKDAGLVRDVEESSRKREAKKVYRNLTTRMPYSFYGGGSREVQFLDRGGDRFTLSDCIFLPQDKHAELLQQVNAAIAAANAAPPEGEADAGTTDDAETGGDDRGTTSGTGTDGSTAPAGESAPIIPTDPSPGEEISVPNFGNINPSELSAEEKAQLIQLLDGVLKLRAMDTFFAPDDDASPMDKAIHTAYYQWLNNSDEDLQNAIDNLKSDGPWSTQTIVLIGLGLLLLAVAGLKIARRRSSRAAQPAPAVRPRAPGRSGDTMVIDVNKATVDDSPLAQLKAKLKNMERVTIDKTHFSHWTNATNLKQVTTIYQIAEISNESASAVLALIKDSPNVLLIIGNVERTNVGKVCFAIFKDSHEALDKGIITIYKKDDGKLYYRTVKWGNLNEQVLEEKAAAAARAKKPAGRSSNLASQVGDELADKDAKADAELRDVDGGLTLAELDDFLEDHHDTTPSSPRGEDSEPTGPLTAPAAEAEDSDLETLSVDDSSDAPEVDDIRTAPMPAPVEVPVAANDTDQRAKDNAVSEVRTKFAGLQGKGATEIRAGIKALAKPDKPSAVTVIVDGESQTFEAYFFMDGDNANAEIYCVDKELYNSGQGAKEILNKLAAANHPVILIVGDAKTFHSIYNSSDEAQWETLTTSLLGKKDHPVSKRAPTIFTSESPAPAPAVPEPAAAATTATESKDAPPPLPKAAAPLAADAEPVDPNAVTLTKQQVQALMREFYGRDDSFKDLFKPMSIDVTLMDNPQDFLEGLIARVAKTLGIKDAGEFSRQFYQNFGFPNDAPNARYLKQVAVLMEALKQKVDPTTGKKIPIRMASEKKANAMLKKLDGPVTPAPKAAPARPAAAKPASKPSAPEPTVLPSPPVGEGQGEGGKPRTPAPASKASTRPPARPPEPVAPAPAAPPPVPAAAKTKSEAQILLELIQSDFEVLLYENGNGHLKPYEDQLKGAKSIDSLLRIAEKMIADQHWSSAYYAWKRKLGPGAGGDKAKTVDALALCIKFIREAKGQAPGADGPYKFNPTGFIETVTAYARRFSKEADVRVAKPPKPSEAPARPAAPAATPTGVVRPAGGGKPVGGNGGAGTNGVGLGALHPAKDPGAPNPTGDGPSQPSQRAGTPRGPIRPPVMVKSGVSPTSVRHDNLARATDGTTIAGRAQLGRQAIPFHFELPGFTGDRAPEIVVIWAGAPDYRSLARAAKLQGNIVLSYSLNTALSQSDEDLLVQEARTRLPSNLVVADDVPTPAPLSLVPSPLVGEGRGEGKSLAILKNMSFEDFIRNSLYKGSGGLADAFMKLSPKQQLMWLLDHTKSFAEFDGLRAEIALAEKRLLKLERDFPALFENPHQILHEFILSRFKDAPRAIERGMEIGDFIHTRAIGRMNVLRQQSVEATRIRTMAATVNRGMEDLRRDLRAEKERRGK